MLIQITNRCRMMCPHCMDASSPDGGLMDEGTFSNIVRFLKENGCVHVTVTGGEPSEHHNLFRFCKTLSDSGIIFTICSNGMWIGDEKKEYAFDRIAKLGRYAGTQIYTNPKWYRLHDDTVARYERNRARFQSMRILLEDKCDIRAMSDIGRAKDCKDAIEESKASRWHNTCLTAHLTAVQVDSMRQLFDSMLAQRRFCTPMFDWKGDFHASESCLCQSFGNVNRDDSETLFRNLKNGRPCGMCIPCKRYLTEDSEKMRIARRLLGQ